GDVQPYVHAAKGPCQCGQQHAPADPDQAGKKPKRSIDKRYQYRDAESQIVFEVVRYKDPRKFSQRRPAGSGEDEWNLKGVERVPYTLPALIAADPAQPIWVTEGEKDADNLIARGLLATCNPWGVGKWRPRYAEALRGHPIVILPHNDDV